jgi:hypothetical protein
MAQVIIKYLKKLVEKCLSTSKHFINSNLKPIAIFN